MQRRLYIDEAHTALDIFRFAVFFMWNSISGLDAWYHFRFDISFGVAVTVRGHQKKNQVIFKGRG